MNSTVQLLFYLLAALAKLAKPGGSRALIAENLLLRQQLIINSRGRKRAPNLSIQDRVQFGFSTLFLNPKRIARLSIIVRPSTLLRFHAALTRRKFRHLYSPRGGVKPGPKGPSKEVINAILEMKRRNPRFGCPRIAQQINLAFGLDLNKDVVRRILSNHYKPDTTDQGPSWLTTLGHAKDSLWSIDLFRCESILMKTHWVMVVMDQYTRRIVGFSVHSGNVDGPALCRMVSQATATDGWPKRISTDNDPLFLYHRWKANLRVLEIEEVKSLPYAPMSHPFVERLIGSIRRELLDQTFFWNATDLKHKLQAYQDYFNQERCHTSRNGTPPVGTVHSNVANIENYRWEKHCRGLFDLPLAA